jgi:uncharacterized protein (DUF1330 family)
MRKNSPLMASSQSLRSRHVSSLVAPHRWSLVEYPSLEKAIAAHNSAGSGEALKALGDGAVRDFRIVEGLD